MRKIAVISFVVALIVAAGALLVWKRRDVHFTPERRLWKNEAIAAITADLKNPDYLKMRFAEVPKPRGEFDTSDSNWLTTDTIVCKDATWLAYRALTHKVDPKIHDIFVAKASDGKWYYTDFHFCKEMYVLESMLGQPESLGEFRKTCYLVQFDGSSDDALKPAWHIRAEHSAGGEGGKPEN